MQKKKLLLGIIPVVLLGFSIGYILWHIIFEYPPHRYSLDFNGAQWISTGDKTPNGYFVKEIFIPDNVADAWISIAATDNAELFVNEEKIAIDTFLSVNLSDIHNVTGKLRHGKNVVAAYVYRMSYPGPPPTPSQGRIYRPYREGTYFCNRWDMEGLFCRRNTGSSERYSMALPQLRPFKMEAGTNRGNICFISGVYVGNSTLHTW